MLSPKYFAQLIQDIKNAHNPEPPENLDDLFVLGDDREGDAAFFEEDEKIPSEDDEEESEIGEEEEEQKIAEYFKEVEAYLEFNEQINDSLGGTLGLDESIFPEAGAFSSDQLEEIIIEFNNMLHSHRVVATIPDGVDPVTKYTLLISLLDESVFLSNIGRTNYDWCTEQSKSCVYGEHCTCIKIEREFENEISYAKSAMRVLHSSLKEFLDEDQYFRYEIDHTLTGEFSNMSMFISHGIPDMSSAVSFFKIRWKDMIIDLKKYLKNYPKLVELFDEDSPLDGYQILEDFLDLSTEYISPSYFRVEPFYIEDGQIVKGYKTSEGDLLNIDK